MRRVPIEDAFDLHSFLPKDVSSALNEYLREALEAGLVEVRLIHGKGIGVRRAEVRRILEKREEVVEFFDAPSERGGAGATIAILKNRGDPGSWMPTVDG